MTSNTHLSAPSTSSRPSFLRSLSSSSNISTTSTKKDKPRLYLALFTKGGANPSSRYNANVTCDSYHWALIVGPKTAHSNDGGTCYQLVHSTNGSTPSSYYEETDLTQQPLYKSKTLLARITLAKVLDEQRVQTLLRSLTAQSKSTSPTFPRSPTSRNQPTFSSCSSSDTDSYPTCHDWLRAAFRLLTSDPSKPLRSYIGPDDWQEVEDCARKYAKKKRTQRRFAETGSDNDDNNNNNVPEYRRWNDDEVATWNFWEKRETTA